MNDALAKKVKSIYTMYHDGRITPEAALDLLEIVFANESETE
jgi:hypothetical protein